MAIQVNGNTVIDNTQNITNVNSYSGDGIATQEEAEDGTNNDQLMTPLRVLDSIKKNGGGMIDKIQEDLELVGPLPTEGAWEWNDNPRYTLGVIGDGGDFSSARSRPLLKSNYGSAVGNQLSTFRSGSATDEDGGYGIQSLSVGFGSPPTIAMRPEDTAGSILGNGQVHSDFDNYAAFGGTILLAYSSQNFSNLNWKRVYNLSINAPTERDIGFNGEIGPTWNWMWMNFSNLESVNGLFGFNFMDRGVQPYVNWPSRKKFFFDAHLKFPKLETIDSIRPVFTWTQSGENFRTSGMEWNPCRLKLEFPELDIESLNKVILGINGPDIIWTTKNPPGNLDPDPKPQKTEVDIAITIVTKHLESDLSTEAQTHWNSLGERFTTALSTVS